MKYDLSTTGRDAAALFALFMGAVVAYGLYQFANGKPLGSNFWSALIFGALCTYIWFREQVKLRVAERLTLMQYQQELPERLKCGIKLGMSPEVTKHIDLESLKLMVEDQEVEKNPRPAQ